MTVDVIEDLNIHYLEMAMTAGLGNWDIFLTTIVPASLPKIVDVLRINLSGAWTFLVAAELVGAESGLGHLIGISQRFQRIEELYVAILLFGVIGVLTDLAIQALNRRLFRWHALEVSR